MLFNLETEEEDGRPIYLTGNFNKWNPKDENYKLSKTESGGYFIEIDDQILPPKIEYKFTKGGWESVEIDIYDNIMPNRKVNRSKKTVNNFVEKWRLNWGPFKDAYFPLAEVISEKFYIPQLDKYRKVWALLPFDYYNSDKQYPVLYLQDAQNLFNEGAEFGNWEIDKKLSLLAEYGRGDLIVVAIEHGDEERMKEYIFDNDAVIKNAEGKKYIRFITDTLKPYVDAKYRTKKDRENTGIGGSSLGALISIYSGFLYPEVYSKLMLFSPSLWIEPQNNFPMLNFKHPYTMKIYLYGGSKEGSKMVNRINKFSKSLEKMQVDKIYDFEIKININPDGHHQEFYWSQEFPRAVEWLYYDSLQDPAESKKPLPAELLNIKNEEK